MVKKLKQMANKKAASASNILDGTLASSVKESAQQIWLAGMGAFSKAQEEGGKVFEALVKEGVSLQRKTQSVAQEKMGEVSSKMGKMTSMASDVGAKAGQQWDRLESIFEERVAKSLSKLGVPSSKDVDALIERIDALTAQVAKLSKPPATAKPAAKKAKPAAKAAKPALKRAAAPAAAKRTSARKAT
jgi:poly(hydroxyalkanoate) granule-associated protein